MATHRRRARSLAVVVVLWMALLSAGCGGGSGEQPPLDGTSWTLTGWAEPDPIPADVTITAEFTDGRVAGTSGVNRYNATVTSDPDGSFAIDKAASTLMAGPEHAMAAERTYLTRLEGATGYAIDGDTLVLRDADGQPSLTFTRA